MVSHLSKVYCEY